MSKITEIYASESYAPFLKYCALHHYQEMGDLLRCPFSMLSRFPGITPVLASRVKVLFEGYRKAHPEEFPKNIAQTFRQASGAGKKNGMSELQLATTLKEYFEANSHRLITLAEAAKQVAGRAKRSEVAAVLQKASWCQMVDGSTFYYVPERKTAKKG